MWYVALALLASRLLLVFFAVRLQDHDGPRYLQEALNMVHHGIYSGLSTVPPPPEAHDLPGYPLVLAGLVLLFKNLWLVAKAAGALNALAFTVAAVELYGLARLAGATERVAMGAMILFGIFPENIPYSVVYLPDSMFFAVFLASLLCAVWYLQEPRPARLWCSFALLGVSVLFRSFTVFFAAILVAAVCVRYFRQKELWRPVLTALLAGLLLEAAVCSPWLIRNHRTFGIWSLSTITGTNLFWCNYQYMLLDKGMSQEAVDARLAAQLQIAGERSGGGSNAMLLSRELQKIALAEIAADPRAYAHTVLKRAPRMFGGTAALELLDMVSSVPHAPGEPLAVVYAKHRALRPLRVLLSTLLCLLYGVTIWGLVTLIRRRMWQPLLLAAIPVLYFMVIYGPVTGSRYRSAMTPFFALAGAFAARNKRTLS